MGDLGRRPHMVNNPPHGHIREGVHKPCPHEEQTHVTGNEDFMEKTTDENENVRPFGIRDKLGYLFGDFGNDFTFILSSSFMLKFYTE